MAGKINFIEGKGGLQRQLPGQDYISGLVLYTNTFPSGFTSTDRIKQIFSLKQAEDLGIVNNHSDEISATGVVTITVAGAIGDTIKIRITEPKKVLTIASYTVGLGETPTTVANAIKNLINLYTYLYGYTATNVAGAITITARKGLGIYPNSTSRISTVLTGTIANTITDFTGGVAGKIAVYHYHISEYFRVQPQGNIYIGINSVPATYTFVEVDTMQTFANGSIRQFGVFKDSSVFSTGDIQALQAVAVTLKNKKQWASILYAGDISSIASASLVSLAGLNSDNVSTVISQDGHQINTDGSTSSGVGYELFKSTGKSVTTLGATLGAVSFSQVSECIGNPARFNMTDGTELAIPALANGDVVKTLSPSLLTQLDIYRYIYMEKGSAGDAGTYHQDSHTCTLQSSDYAYIENVRTIYKAQRLLDIALFPYRQSKIVLNSDGTISDTSVVALESVSNSSLNAMLTDGDLSNRKAVVDPAQNVQSTGKVVVAMDLLAQPIARLIEVRIGYVLSIN